MNSELQILVIAYGFPPNAEVGTKRVVGFCRYLPGCGIRPIVVTAEGRFYWWRDDSFPVPVGLHVERTPVLSTPLDLYRRLKACFGSTESSGNDSGLVPGTERRGFLRHQTLTLLATPDLYWGWYWPAVQAAERLIEREPIAAVFSTAPPWTSHLVARHLKKKYRIPWVADFRDAWTSDKWHLEEDLPGWRVRVDHRLEASCLRWADLVLCVTDYIREDFTQRYPRLPAAKFVTLTNGYDDSVGLPTSPASAALAESAAWAGSKRPTRLLLHLGWLYGGRRIDTFCQAVASLVRSGKLDPSSFKILFLGDADPSVTAAAHQLVPELIQNKWIEFQARVSWQKGQESLASADVLLIFQGDHPGVSAKFYEYLQTGKPIFAIVEEGPLSRMLKVTGSGIWADPGDPADIASKLLQALELPARPPEEVKRLASQYHYRSLTAQLAAWVRELATANAQAGG